MAKHAVKLGRLDAAIIISLVVFASYFVLLLPVLPQRLESIALAAPLMMGTGVLIALAGLVISIIAVALVMRDSATNRPPSYARLSLGIIGITIYGISIPIILLITVSFMLGIAQL